MTETNYPALLMRMINGFQLSMAIHVAAKLKIADLLTEGPQSNDSLAEKTETNAAALYRMLRMMAAAGILEEDDAKRFSLTPLGTCLKSDARQPVAPWAIHSGSENNWRAWGDLLHAVKTGQTAFSHAHGTEVWEYRNRHEQDGRIFHTAMDSLSKQAIKPVLDAYDFGGFGKIVDVGGGYGAVLAAILTKNPNSRGVLFDQAEVIANAEGAFRDAGLAERCVFQSGDYFKDVPKGGDAYLLKSILHDWNDEEALQILKACREAIPDTGKLLIIEYMIGSPNGGLAATMIDVNMLVTQHGRVRSKEEFGSLLSESGFSLKSVIQTAAPLCILEAIPVKPFQSGRVEASKGKSTI